MALFFLGREPQKWRREYHSSVEIKGSLGSVGKQRMLLPTDVLCLQLDWEIMFNGMVFKVQATSGKYRDYSERGRKMKESLCLVMS